jgi:thermitase
MAQQAPSIDQQAHTVAITSPTENSTQEGIFNINVNAEDNIAVSSVSLYADGIFIGSDNVAPFSISFDSHNVADGNVALTARAEDAAGNLGSSATHWLVIDNVVDVADSIAPNVSITNPADGSTVSGNVAITVSATDNVAVTKVELYIDGRLKAQTNTSVLSYGWNSRKAGAGLHTILSKAFDAAGNQTQSSVQVNITTTKKRGRK